MQLPESSPSNSNNNWQEDLWSFGNEEEDGCETDDDIDLEELSKALSEAGNLTSSGKKQRSDTKSSRKSLPTGQSARSIDDKIPGKLHISVILNMDFELHFMIIFASNVEVGLIIDI